MSQFYLKKSVLSGKESFLSVLVCSGRFLSVPVGSCRFLGWPYFLSSGQVECNVIKWSLSNFIYLLQFHVFAETECELWFEFNKLLITVYVYNAEKGPFSGLTIYPGTPLDTPGRIIYLVIK